MFTAFYGIIHCNPRGDPRVTLKGNTIYLCGLPCHTRAEADQLARAAARTSHGPTCYLPRVFEQQPGESFLDVCDRAGDWFERLIKDMGEADGIHSRARQ